MHQCNDCHHGKALSITYSECTSVALVTQHAKHMCHIILSFVACLALKNFFHIIAERHDFQKKKVVEHKVCVF